jgi:nucleoid DNA-binding protein
MEANTNVNKKELVAAMAAKTDTSGAAADRAVNAMLEIISDTLQKGEAMTLLGFVRSKYVSVPHGLAAIPRP